MLGPRERDRDADVLEAGEAPGAHRAVDRLEARRVGVGADEPQRSLGRHARRRALTVPASASRRPAGLRTSAGSTGRDRPARGRARSPRLGASGSGHSPAGAIAVTDRAWPAAASSSATQPPSELPGHVVRAAGRQARRDGRGERGGRRRAAAVERRRLAEAGQVDRDHVALGGEALHHRRPHVAVGAERVQQDEHRARCPARSKARLNGRRRRRGAAVSSAEPPATASVAGAAPSGSPRRPATVAAMSARSPATLAARNGRSGSSRSAAAIAAPWTTISRAPRPRSGTWAGGVAGGGPEPAEREPLGRDDQRRRRRRRAGRGRRGWRCGASAGDYGAAGGHRSLLIAGARRERRPEYGPHRHAPRSSPAPTAASAAPSARRSPPARCSSCSPACATPTRSSRSSRAGPPDPHGPLEPRVDRRVRRGIDEPVDLLINNAGQMTGGLLEEQDMDAVYAMFQVNLVARRAPDQPPAAGHARARPRHDRQQRLDQRLRVLPRRQHLRRVEGRRGRADRVAAARARRHRRPRAARRHARRQHRHARRHRGGLRPLHGHLGLGQGRAGGVGARRCSPPSRRTSRSSAPAASSRYAKLASRGPAFVLDALSGRMFSRQPRR